METGKGEAQGAYGEQAIAVSCEEPQLKSASGDSKLYLRHLRVQVWLRGCCHHLSNSEWVNSDGSRVAREINHRDLHAVMTHDFGDLVNRNAVVEAAMCELMTEAMKVEIFALIMLHAAVAAPTV